MTFDPGIWHGGSCWPFLCHIRRLRS